MTMPSSLSRWPLPLRRSEPTFGSSSQSINQAQGNRCLLQGFEWNVPGDQKHWKRLKTALESLKSIGIDDVWLPPGCKATHAGSNGYDIYDLYDLGEFDQKGGMATKWGTKDDLLELSSKARSLGIGLIWDAVLSHKAGADSTEKCHAVEVDADDRNLIISKPHEIEAWLRFDFEGRACQYSSQKYCATHFSGTDLDCKTNKKGIFLTAKAWSKNVDTNENGNFDYLMFSNLNYSNDEVRLDVLSWACWIPTQISLSGFRFDAARHIDYKFLLELINSVRSKFDQQPWLFIGEYWQDSVSGLRSYLKRMRYSLCLFDAPLLYNFNRASRTLRFDLRRLLKNTLVEKEPEYAVTIVANHDTQPGQTLNAPVAPSYQTLAYSIILLRKGGLPCVFYGDLYGILPGDDCTGSGPACGGKLADLVLARKIFAYGRQHDYLDERSLIGWTREGTSERPYGLAVVGSNDGKGIKRMFVGAHHAGETWTDLWEWDSYKTVIDPRGWGRFMCGGTGVNVFVKDDAQGRAQFGAFNSNIYAES